MFGKYFLLLILASAGLSTAFPEPATAQEETFACSKDVPALPAADAQKLLGKVQTQYAKLAALRAKFVQHEILPGMGSVKQRTGTLYYANPKRMKWDYATPEKLVYLINDKIFWQYDAEQKSAVKYEFEKVVLTKLSISFLMGMGNLGSDFTLERACTRKEGVVFYLKPKPGTEAALDLEAEDEMQGIRLLVDADKYYPLGIYVEQLGNITVVFLRESEYDPKLNTEVFAANFPRGTDIDDRTKLN